MPPNVLIKVPDHTIFERQKGTFCSNLLRIPTYSRSPTTRAFIFTLIDGPKETLKSSVRL